VTQTLKQLLTNSPLAILPAEFVQVAPGSARLWCLVRSLDHPDNGKGGCGILAAALDELANWLNRSTRTVWRYLSEALRQGFIRRHWWEGDRLFIEYAGIKAIAKKLGLKSIGAVGCFPLAQIEHAKAKAAEIQAEDLQRKSFYKMREEWGRFSRGAKSAAELLSDWSPSARVSGGERIARGNRLLYLAPWVRPFGASQASIANRIGVCTRTVQNRLSNAWREERGIEPIEKAQAAYQINEGYPKYLLQEFMKVEEYSERKYVFLGARLFKIGCNLYSTSTLLRTHRFRKSQYASSVLQNGNSEAVFSTATPDNTGCYTVEKEAFENLESSPKLGKATRL
jgi:hypothetical protein